MTIQRIIWRVSKRKLRRLLYAARIKRTLQRRRRLVCGSRSARAWREWQWGADGH